MEEDRKRDKWKKGRRRERREGESKEMGDR
jgi:hypothetical protein